MFKNLVGLRNELTFDGATDLVLVVDAKDFDHAVCAYSFVVSAFVLLFVLETAGVYFVELEKISQANGQHYASSESLNI